MVFLYHRSQTHLNGCFLKWWGSPTTMGFPTKNDHFGVFWGYHHLRKPPNPPKQNTSQNAPFDTSNIVPHMLWRAPPRHSTENAPRGRRALRAPWGWQQWWMMVINAMGWIRKEFPKKQISKRKKGWPPGPSVFLLHFFFERRKRIYPSGRFG